MKPNPAHCCNHCHTCGTHLQNVLDGEEYCRRCQAYRRYRSHGWARSAADDETTTCPPVPATPATLPVYRIERARPTGGKAGKGRNLTSTLRVVEDHGQFIFIVKAYRYTVNDPASYAAAYEKARIKLTEVKASGRQFAPRP